MKYTDNLFRLIKSLSKSERRYIKLYYVNNGSRETNYSRLFDAIEKQTTYDHNDLKKKFEGTTFVKQLNVTKKQLYNIILTGLRNYRAKSSDLIKATNCIQNIETLYVRGLFDLAKSELNTANNTIQKKEMNFLAPGLAPFSRLLLFKPFVTEQGTELIKPILSLSESSIKKLDVDTQYWKLFYDSHILLELFRFHGHKPASAQLEPFALLEPPKGVSKYSYYYYLRTKINYFWINMDFKNLKIYCWKLVGWIVSKKFCLVNYEQELWVHIFNFALVHLDFYKFNAFLKEVEKIKPIDATDKVSRSKKWYIINCMKFYSLFELRRINEAGLLIPVIVKGYTDYIKNSPVYDAQNVLLKISGLYFLKQEYSNCIKHTYSILMDEKLENLPEIDRYARLLILASHYEKGNSTTWKNLLSEQRQFSSVQAKGELLIILFYEKVLTGGESKELIKSTLNEANSIPKIHNTFNAFDYFDFKTYLKNKLQA